MDVIFKIAIFLGSVGTMLLVKTCEEEIPQVEQEEFVYSFDCCTDSLHFYYLDNQIRSLELSKRCITIKIKERSSKEFLQYLTNEYYTIDTIEYYNEGYGTATVYLKDGIKCEEMETLLQNLFYEYHVIWALPIYQDSSRCEPWARDECELIRLTDIITLQLKDTVPRFVLDSLITLTNSTFIEGPIREVWYSITVDKHSTLNCLDMSRYFYETGYFDNAVPHFIIPMFNFKKLNLPEPNTRYSQPLVH